MLGSKVIVIQIERPWEEVYDFLAEPLNFSRWAANPGSEMVPLGGNEWLVEVPNGKTLIRFAERNSWGVLDYHAVTEGREDGRLIPVRLYRNGDGAELQFFWTQREGTADEAFASEAEWIASDLLRLKALLEAPV